MRTIVFVIATGLGLATFTPNGHGIGCLSGAAAGALGGHMMGHSMVGAIGGCIAGHEWHKHQQRLTQQDLQNEAAYNARRQQIDPSYQNPWNQDH